MKLLRDISELGTLPGALHLAIGVFDGLHLGHQAVIGAAQLAAREQGGTVVVVTFDPHPIEVLSPRHAPRLLSAPEHKLVLLERELGVRHCWVIPFDLDRAGQTGAEFIGGLLAATGPGRLAGIYVGEQWRFGQNRSGDLALLETLGVTGGFVAVGLATVEIEGAPVSSTRIREAIGAGDFAVAKRLLGRDYTVYGTVVEGRRLGRTIGFPTANLRVHREQLPPTGVYAVRATGRGDGWNGVANLGYRPTVSGDATERLLEVHLFDFVGDIYGEVLEVEFVEFLRAERKFAGVEELKAQIARDAGAARAVVSGR
jgi:riboflavin kinase/FMN adenylyltransferase